MSLKRVVAVCFPRSGSYFLTTCLSRYFGVDFKYLEPYANTSTFPQPRFNSRLWGARYLNFKHFRRDKNDHKEENSKPHAFSEANFIRFHDFSSFPQRSQYMSEEGVEIEKRYCLDNVENQATTSYLVLIRHPIETIQSYYELLVHTSGLPDSYESWISFQGHALEYWTTFADKWVLNPNDSLIKNKTVVLYEDLAKNTEVALSRVVSCFSHKELIQKQIKEVARLRYASIRHISDFKYFDARNCENVQDQLHDTYLRPMGITPYVNFNRSPLFHRDKFVRKLVSKMIS
jgi:hypothetical protein